MCFCFLCYLIPCITFESISGICIWKNWLLPYRFAWNFRVAKFPSCKPTFSAQHSQCWKSCIFDIAFVVNRKTINRHLLFVQNIIKHSCVDLLNSQSRIAKNIDRAMKNSIINSLIFTAVMHSIYDHIISVHAIVIEHVVNIEQKLSVWCTFDAMQTFYSLLFSSFNIFFRIVWIFHFNIQHTLSQGINHKASNRCRHLKQNPDWTVTLWSVFVVHLFFHLCAAILCFIIKENVLYWVICGMFVKVTSQWTMIKLADQSHFEHT